MMRSVHFHRSISHNLSPRLCSHVSRSFHHSSSAHSSTQFISSWRRLGLLGVALGSTMIGTALSSSSSPLMSAPVAALSTTPKKPICDIPPFKVALIQLKVGEDKQANLDNAAVQIAEAVKQGARVVVLPEMFNSPYANASFGPYSEQLPSVCTSFAAIPANMNSALFLAKQARKHAIVLVGGSVPERSTDGDTHMHQDENGKFNLYNTCLVFNSDGDVIAKHRKVHLFDIDVPGKMTFFESATLAAGQNFTVFDSPYGRIGVGICYDIRFPEYAQLLTQHYGADLLIYPAAFNATTGPLHWELLARSRAVDNQSWLLLCSPARNTTGYQAYGHTMAVTPWGHIAATTEEKPDIVMAEIDLKQAEEMRKMIPVRMQKRRDMYKIDLVQPQK